MAQSLRDPVDDIRDHEAAPGEHDALHDDSQSHYNDEFEQLTSPQHFNQNAEEPAYPHEEPSALERTRDDIKERAQEKGSERLREAVKDRLGNRGASEGAKKGLQEGAEKGLEQGGKQLAEKGAEQAVGKAAEVGAQAGAEAAVEAGALTAAEGGAVAAGAASAPETAGIGLAVGIAAAVGIFAVKHWKGALFIVGSLGLGGFIGLVYLLSVFKPIITTLQTAHKYQTALQDIVLMRSQKILASYIYNGSKTALVGNALPGKQLPQGQASELFKTMREGGFEDRLQQKYGVTFTPTNGNKSIAINKDGKSLGLASSQADVERILTNNDGLTSQILDEEVHAWDWAQHFEIARKSAAAFDLQQLNIPGAATATDGTQVADVVKYQVNSVVDPALTHMSTAVTCLDTNTSCNDTGTPLAGEAPAKPELQADQQSSIETAAQTAHKQQLDSISDQNDYQVDKLVDVTNKNLTDSLSKQTLSMLGWLDLSTAVHLINDKPGYSQIPPKLRSQQAGSLWTWWWSASGQMLAGDVSQQAGSVIGRNFRGAETAQAYNYIAYDDTSTGKGLKPEDKINSADPAPMKTLYRGWLNSNTSFGDIPSLFDAWNVVRGKGLTLIITFARDTPLFQFLNNFGTKIPIVGTLFNVFVKAPIDSVVGSSYGLSSKLLMPVYDPVAQDSDFMNSLASGAHASADDTCVKVFGCGEHTQAEMQEIKTLAQQADARQLSYLPLNERLFSSTAPNSLLRLAVLRSPIKYESTTNMASALNGVFGFVKAIPNNLAQIYSQPVHAASADPSQIDGVAYNKAIAAGTLQNTALSPQINSDADTACPQTQAGQDNICMGDTAVMHSWLARYIGYDAAVAKGL